MPVIAGQPSVWSSAAPCTFATTVNCPPLPWAKGKLREITPEGEPASWTRLG